MCIVESVVSCASVQKKASKRTLTVRCWKSHARMMLVATLGKMPRFFCRFLSLSGSSSSPVPGEATLLSKPSPNQNESFLETEHKLLQPSVLFIMLTILMNGRFIGDYYPSLILSPQQND